MERETRPTTKIYGIRRWKRMEATEFGSCTSTDCIENSLRILPRRDFHPHAADETSIPRCNSPGSLVTKRFRGTSIPKRFGTWCFGWYTIGAWVNATTRSIGCPAYLSTLHLTPSRMHQMYAMKTRRSGQTQTSTPSKGRKERSD